MVDFYKMLTGKTREELIRPEILALRERGSVTWAEFDQRMNSYERSEIIPALTDDAFLRHFVHCASNVGGNQPGTYDYAVARELAPEAIRRGMGPPMSEMDGKPGIDVRLVWRGSVTDLVTDLKGHLTALQLVELATLAVAAAEDKAGA